MGKGDNPGMNLASASFDRLKSKGLEAYRAGQYSIANAYLAQAAELMLEMAVKAPTPTVREQRKSMAGELVELAREAKERAARSAPPPPARSGGGGGGSGGSNRQAEQSGGKEEDDASKADEWIVREKPNITFEDVAGLDQVKQDIRLKMIYPFKHPELAAQYGISKGGGILLWGPPGTGKTMIAKAMAGEIEATMYVISPAQIMSKWVGEAEQNVKKLFESARANAPSMIFMDEIEALVPSRSKEGSTGVMQRVIPQILQEIEGFDRKGDRAILFMGATNVPWNLDTAMLRPGRFDTRVYVPLPDPPARLKLLEIYLGRRPLGPDVDFDLLVDRLDGYSGADIKAIGQRAATIPFLEGVQSGVARPIGMGDILQALREISRSVTPNDLKRFEAWAKETAAAG